MAPPRNNDRPTSSGHTGTIPKSKVRNNCNVPQEAVTPTRRDLASNLVSTSLDWVPVSEYNTRSNHNQSRKPSNNTSDHDLNDLDNSLAFESGFGRFVPVRPQPRVLPLNVQNRENPDQHDEGPSSSMSAYSLHPYSHSMHNGINAHSNHAAAAVMIVNPTTPNAVGGNLPQGYNTSNFQPSVNQNRNNLARNLNPSRNNFEGNSSNNNSSQASSRSGNKAVNLINNMYEQQGSTNNLHENNPVSQRENARALGEALVAACPDASAVERRLGQIREYIRVTSSLVDTMRNSEDEAYIEHTKEEYDELIEMIMKLKESETQLVQIMEAEQPDNTEVPKDDYATLEQTGITKEENTHINTQNCIEVNDTNAHSSSNVNLKKVTNIENEQINKTLHNESPNESNQVTEDKDLNLIVESPSEINLHKVNGDVEIQEIETSATDEVQDENVNKDELQNTILRQNIMSCVEKVALIEELKAQTRDEENQDIVVRPISAQSNGSAYSENELWQSEIKNKMEVSSQRLVALKQQQQRLLKYQAEAKMQLDEINRRHSQEIQPSTSNDHLSDMQQQQLLSHRQLKRGPTNQVGVATTLAHSSDNHNNVGVTTNSNIDNEPVDDRYSHRTGNHASSEEANGRDSDEDEGILSERGRQLQMKLRELQMKKQHMENLVSEFQKLQMDQQMESARNTYSSSGEESADEGPSRKCNNAEGNIKNEDPFKLMEIKAIKAALQKTKDLMRTVENYESEQISGMQDEPYQGPSHSNLHDNKSEDGGSAGGWSNDGSVCRVRNSLPQRRKYTNEQHHHQSHEANLASLQDLAQQLRMETEKIMGERARLKDVIANRELIKHKKVNEERPRTSTGPIGPAERRQMELKALLAQKQKELEALINNDKSAVNSDSCKAQQKSRSGSIINQSFNSEHDESEPRQSHMMMNPQNAREPDSFTAGGDSGLVCRTLHNLSSQVGSMYCSDSDSASRTKSGQRNRSRRKQQQEIQPDDNIQVSSSNQNLRHEPRVDSSNVNLASPLPHTNNGDIPVNMQYPHIPPPPSWGSNKSNQDMRTNQFTQNSHSQTMDRLLGTPPMSLPPPSMPFNMMMPYGMMGSCGCSGGCGLWGAWCWQQLLLHQRELAHLREQLTHLEERWRAETASNILNNQVPPGNRANNYWDNFRSYSRQNLLSSNKAVSSTPAGPHKRNMNPACTPPGPTPAAAPDVVVADPAIPRTPRHNNLAPSPPDIYNINSTHHGKNKASTKLPAKNSPHHRTNQALDYAQTTNINIASTSAAPAPNPNLASAANDKSTSKLFDLLRENVYSEVTALIGVNESHPDFLIQLFRELQAVSSDPLRQRVLHSIRTLLSQTDNQNVPSMQEDANEALSTTNHDDNYLANNTTNPPIALNNIQIDNGIIHFLLHRSEEVCTLELLETLATLILNSSVDNTPSHFSKKNILDILAKYEGMRVSDVSNDIISCLPEVINDNNEADESTQHTNEVTEASTLQDVAGSLNLLNQNDSQFHQLNACPYENWHIDIDNEHRQESGSSRHEAKMDLINCSEMNDGDLAEADQTCRGDIEEHEASRDDLVPNGETLPDLVETEEATPTEAEAEWLGLDRVPTRLHHMEDASEKQKD